MLSGQEVPLPVAPGDSLALKVEALRCYLEDALGTGPFLKVGRGGGRGREGEDRGLC